MTSQKSDGGREPNTALPFVILNLDTGLLHRLAPPAIFLLYLERSKLSLAQHAMGRAV